MMRERGQPDSFVKSRADAPAGFFETEAAGLRWLTEPGVVPVVEVLEVQENALHLERLDPAPPTAEAARAFGERLAALHDAGAPGFGWSPGQTAWLLSFVPPKAKQAKAIARSRSSDRLAKTG